MESRFSRERFHVVSNGFIENRRNVLHQFRALFTKKLGKLFGHNELGSFRIFLIRAFAFGGAVLLGND